MNRHLVILTISLITALFIAGCTVKKYVPDNKYLVKKNTVILNHEAKGVSKSNIESYITPKQNKSTPSLVIYYKTANKTQNKFWRWLNNNFGNTPIYLDESLCKKSTRQIAMYLNNIGYFDSKVKETIHTKKHYAYVSYNVTLTEPYVVQNIKYVIPDTTIARYVSEINERLTIGSIYDAFKLEDQRDEITSHLRNNGYYFFNKNYIRYEVDSSFNNHQLNITMYIDNTKDAVSGQYHPHRQYYINKINIFPNYSTRIAQDSKLDAMEVSFGKKKNQNTLNFYYFGDPRIRFKTFEQAILIRQNAPYSQKSVSQTYSALGSFKIFSNTNIVFDTIPGTTEQPNLLNCNILLQRAHANHYKIQIEGTNTGGDLGVRGGISFNNKNLFRGAELLSLSTKFGFEAQKIAAVTEVGEENVSIFNTREIGINAKINFPRFLSPIKLSSFISDYQPKTALNFGYNLQIRTQYSRFITTAAFSYDWKASKNVQHVLTPINLNSVKVEPSPAFEAALNEELNQRIKDQYTNHLIFGLNYTYTFSNQDITNLHDFIYFRGNFESSGNLLSLFNNTSLISTLDTHHELFGIRYAQYVRFDFDLRYYHVITKDNQIVLRSMIGLGVPYGNSKDMPFERSFYAGGANGMRGWAYRELGPGAFSNPNNLKIERIGDIQLEVNAEYRFPIYEFLKGAIYCDAGNIWTFHENDQLKDGNFKFDTFYKQIAVDAGLGFRFDFSFFIFRIDLAVPIRNPQLPEDSRWCYDNLKLKDIVLNFGIGYPF